MPDPLPILFWTAWALGLSAAATAFLGRTRVLPNFLTGPRTCRMEAGGCQALFRSRDASLWGLPNSALGILYYLLLGLGTLAAWPKGPLLLGASLALGMSFQLAWILLKKGLECRVCWTGHLCNLTLWLLLLLRVLR